MDATAVQRVQHEQRAMFMAVLDALIEQCAAIDKATPGDSEIAPEWWLQMSKLRGQAVAIRQALGLGVDLPYVADHLDVGKLRAALAKASS